MTQIGNYNEPVSINAITNVKIAMKFLQFYVYGSAVNVTLISSKKTLKLNLIRTIH